MAVNVAAAPVGYQGNRDASYWDLLGECLVWCRLCRFCVWLDQRKLAQRSERVKSADLHPTEPWILSSLYSGSVCIWNYQTQLNSMKIISNDDGVHLFLTMVKSFEVTELPVRSAKFIARKQWVVAGADDMFIRVYNYNTMDKVKVFEAHTDYIRCVAVHPTQPFVLSSSDDMLIKLWDWDKGWACTHIFEGHSHYVMQVTFNPKDTNTFASASLDRTIKIWSIGSPDPNFTLDGHSKGVNCVDYFTGGDRPFLITGSDDQTAKVWDYQTKSCVQTLEGHAHNVSAVCFHPELPIIITGSEDGTVRLWHSTTYRLENTLNYGLERVWALGYMKGSRRIVIGYDEGTIMIKIGREVPVASMDNSGKIIWAKHNEIQTVNIKTVGAGNEIADGERLPLAVKELGSCDLYPQTALAWRNRSFGSALEFAWSSDGEYAVRESTSRIKIYSKNFQERKSIRPTFSVERVFGGVLLAMCTNDFICFYDWADCRLIRRIDVNVKNLYWADSGDLVTVASDTSFYILKYNRDVVSSHLDGGGSVGEEGVEDAFELLHEINERIRTGLWVGDCFIYNNSSSRLNYCVGGEAIALEVQSESKWKQLGELAISTGKLEMAEECLLHALDLSGLLLLYSSIGDAEGITKLASMAKEQGKNNVAFLCLFMLGKLEECLQLLIESNRIPEAALMARSYLPSKVPEIVALWKKDLQKVNSKAAESLADPDEYPNLFEDWQIALNVEATVAPKRGIYPPAEEYMIHSERPNESLVEAFKNMHVQEEEDVHEEDIHDEELTNENDTVQEVFEDDGAEESQEDAVEVEADGSTDGTIHVNGNDSEEQWGTNKEEPSA
ncbi:unnamed protein product [Triticum turgidum subsp. durum]|uniref:Coatomer subunit beta' n=1 Tax=Triticum turgidum subsp. durum TaxID=4567 RepID=A0A9R0XZK0_TRITD|nr:unnamed protein product [Triticum turgidum subsp. durum]